MKTITVTNNARGWCVGHHIEIADSPYSRAKGLLGRTDLSAGNGLWIIPSNGVHTFGMQFSIDVIGVDRKLRIVRLWRDLKQNRLTLPSFKVKSVFELPSGSIDAMQASIGDLLTIHEH